jgi:hypothetical protein
MTIKLPLALVAMAMVFIVASPAGAMKMVQHNAKHACEQFVKQYHPDLKGHLRKVEIAKCNQDGDAYVKATGI